jgi:ribonuclease Z
MEIVFLGTTAAVPTSARGHVAIALKYHNEIILWDCGEGIQRQLIRSRTNYMKINKIFVTHFHGDHFLGIPGLIQTMSFADRSQPLHIYGPKGIEKLMKGILNLGEYAVGFKIYAHEMSDDMVIDEEKYMITCLAVKHSIPTYGLLFEEKKGREFLLEKAKALGIPKGHLYSKLQRGEEVEFNGKTIHPDDVLGEQKKGFRVIYSSDTRPCDSIADNCKDAVLIHDGTFDESLSEHAVKTDHSTVIEAAELAKKGSAKALYLIHISPRYKKEDLLLEQAKKVFEGTIITRDLMRVVL